MGDGKAYACVRHGFAGGREDYHAKARDGEKLKTLDGVERKLTSEDLVVCDAQKPVGLAGVMGGYDTMITEKTRNIVIESAWWDPGIVRKMSRRHGLHTDASHRFERGADFESTVVSCDLVAADDSGVGRRRTGGRRAWTWCRGRWIWLRWCCGSRRCGGFWAGGWMSGEIFRMLKRLGFTLIPEGQARRAVSRADSELASGRGARDRRDRRNRAAAWL